MRVFNLYVPSSLLALALCDLVVLYASIICGLLASYSSIAEIYGGNGSLDAQALIYVSTNMMTMFAMGLHNRRHVFDLAGVIIRLVVALGLGVVTLTVVFYVLPAIRIWISALLPATVIALVSLSTVRGLFRYIAAFSTLRRRILVLGAGEQARRLEIVERSVAPAGFTCAGFVAMDERKIAVDRNRVLAGGSVESLCESVAADEIVLALDERRGVVPVNALLPLRLRGVRITDVSTFIEREVGKLEIDLMRPSMLFLSDGGTRGRIERVAKRGFDIAASLALLLVTLPVTIPTVVATYAEDRGPIFYRQERVGFGNRVFNLLKFRSMHADAERDGIARWAAVRDSRVTRVGRVIRQLRIDEIPQVYNVLRGEMSFVGPRPERPTIVKELAAEIPFYNYRHTVKPGITGWAQINYPYGASIRDAREKLMYDLYYVKNFSLFFDCIVLLQTLRVVLWPQGVR